MTHYDNQLAATNDEREQEHHCDCHAHCPKNSQMYAGSWWSSVIPALACAFCPACLATYTKVLSILGLGVDMSESFHLALLTTALTFSLGMGLIRARSARRWKPFALTVAGCALILASHFADDHPLLTWSGILMLLGSGAWEHLVWRRARFEGRPVAASGRAS